ncbi:uncharacterized protein LOC130756821 isoform X1 [Actinidia eriantha]|uniref:uncharacterized protein LOC130756821 isoform X1 n=1 Tax=Actinidia eriantha TaxID=165200 RepID=UPI00258E2FD4|nr:uncharacterized protein LOC130756821 isoform X1 [Actinidia eriantha]
MASIYRSRRTTDERSGGKMVRRRRIAAAKTPYDRPIPENAPPQNPNWLTGFIFPTSRMIATSATKLISSIINSDNSSSSSSSASDSSSEDFIDDENDSYHIPFDGVDGLHEKNGTTSQLIECFGKEHQLTARKSETKCVIEKLLMQETFTREECDRLTKIINSRVVDGSAMEERLDGRLDLCSKAVMEAKQWLEEKKIASSSKSDLDLGTYTPNSVVISQVTKGEGSPVDVAKSYMQARPPWASPSINNVESRTPSPIGRELLKEETPYSVAGNSFSLSKKIYSLGSGSWNIQEEIRRVRSKATEDMLKTTPSMKIDLSSFSLEPKSIQKSLLADKTDFGRGEKGHDLNYLIARKSIDASAELAAGVSPCHGIPALEMTVDGSQNEDLSSQPVISSAQNQGLVAIRIVEGEEHAAAQSHHPTIPDLALEHDSVLSERICSSAKEGIELRGDPNANGFPYSGLSLSAGHGDQNPRPSNDKNPSPISSNHKTLANSIPAEETCELLSEASMEVPVVNETNSIAGDSQNSSSMQCEELLQEMTQLNPPVHRLTGKTTNMVDKQQGRKMTRHNRKSRGKG